MNGVLGIAESLKTNALDPQSRHKLALLRQCAGHLSSLLEDILDFSRVQAGVELESKPFNLAGLLDSVFALTAADSERCGIPVEVAIAPAVPAELMGDQRRIRQILLNFVSNALKFAGRGQVKITVWCKPGNAATTEIFFAVSDEGPGIPPEDQQRLFTRFERGTTAQFGRVPGTGLGLALCRTLAEKMGGRVWMESAAGEGSCFYFSAEFANAGAQPRPAPETLRPPDERIGTALVVDDEEYNRVALAGLLEEFGLAVQTADDGPAAVVLAGRHDFDIIFLDCALPGRTGPEVSREIRQLPGRSARAVIFAVTAFSTPAKRAECLAAGMNAFLGKPVTMERLRQVLVATIPRNAPLANPPAPAPPADDRLAGMRLVAARKQRPLADELALYFSEFEVELQHLTAALLQEEAGPTGQYAHLLCGRCAFINESELEQSLRKVIAAAAAGCWNDAQSLGRELHVRVADLRIKLVSGAPVVPLGSAR